jgi:hypothetical protein
MDTICSGSLCKTGDGRKIKLVSQEEREYDTHSRAEQSTEPRGEGIRIPFHRTLSHLILSHPIPSHPILSCPVSDLTAKMTA